MSANPMSVGIPVADRGLERRHRAALELLQRGFEADGELLLSYVVWPTPTLEQAVAAALRRGSPRVRARRSLDARAD